MSRPLHIAAALSAFALGLVVAGASGQLPYAVPAAALVAVALRALWRRARRPAFDAHRLTVAALTLLLWIPLLGFFSLFIVTPFDTYISFEGDYYEPGVEEESTEYLPVAPASVWDSGEVCRPGTSASVNWHANVIWAGAIDRKAVDKPQPFYPPDARAAQVSGTVAVAVLVDESGLVLGARPLSGHPLLRQEAARAACSARFHPALINGAPLRVSGLLTYGFEPECVRARGADISTRARRRP
jgi:TonB family protein